MSNPEAARARAQLRSLINQVDDRRAELTSTTSCGISNIIGQANNMYDVTSKDTRTSAVDASLIAKTAALGAEQAGNLEKTTPDAWVKMLAVAFGQGREGKRINWKRLGEGVVEARVFKESPGVVFLLGEWEGPAVKKTRERKQKARGPDEPLQTADTADVSQIQEEREDKAQARGAVGSRPGASCRRAPCPSLARPLALPPQAHHRANFAPSPPCPVAPAPRPQ